MTTVLIAAGDPVTALGLDMILSEAGYAVVRLGAGGDVGEALDASHADGVLLDASLEGRDGFTVLDALRRAGRVPALPLVMMIGRSSPVEKEKARALGAAAVVTKPFAGSALVEVVGRIVGRPAPRRLAPQMAAGVAWSAEAHG